MTYQTLPLPRELRRQLRRLPIEDRSAALAAIWTTDGTPPNHDWRKSDEPEHLNARMAAVEWFNRHRELDALDPNNPGARELQQRLDPHAVANIVRRAELARDTVTSIPTALCATELGARILGRPLPRLRKKPGPCPTCRKHRHFHVPAGHIAEDVGPGAYVLVCGGLWLD